MRVQVIPPNAAGPLMITDSVISRSRPEPERSQTFGVWDLAAIGILQKKSDGANGEVF